MKILWFTNTPSLAAEALNDKGNIGGWIAALEAELVKVDGVELAVAFHYGTSEKKQFSILNTKYFSFPYPILSKGHKRGIISRWKHKIEPIEVVNNYLEVVELFKPDVIHIFGTEHAYGLIIDKIKVPVVIQIQGNLSVINKKWFSGLSNFDILRYSNIKNIVFAYGVWHQYFNLKKRAIRERELMKNCLNIIGRTDWDRRITRILSPKSKYFHCDELLRSDFYISESWKFNNHTKAVLHSTLSPINFKGIETILEAVTLLKSDKFMDFEWRIAGIDGKEEIIRIIEKSLGKKFIDYGIKFLGNLDSTNLIRVLLEADCYVHPSHIENSPNSVCEAMLLGVPVIATFAGGTSSLISDRVEGILIQDGDPYSLSGAILELEKDSELKLKISYNAKIKAGARHCTENVIGDLLYIYNSILSDNSSLYF